MSRRVKAFIPGVLFALTMIPMLLTGIIRFLACSAPVMKGLMEEYAPSAVTLLPEREYGNMAGMITGYLAGREDTFQYVFTDDQGIRRICFHDYEQQHMADCAGLIRLDEKVMGISAALAVIFLLAGIFLKNRKGFCRGGLTGLGIGLALILGIGIWAVSDFDGLFIRFHLTAFSNDLWLLDPRTDLLIRLMPTEFFVAYGIRGALMLLGSLLLFGIVLWFAGHKERLVK